MPETRVLLASNRRSTCEAAKVLAEGGVVAFPTDTVYGLGAHSQCEAAVERLYTLKGRSHQKAIALLIGTADDLAAVGRSIPEIAWRLALRYWPGPLTLVLFKAPKLLDVVTAGGPSVAVRVPAHPDALRLIADVGAPVAATSANLSGRAEAATAEEVGVVFANQIPMILDGGRCQGGVPSTVVDVTVTPPLIRRRGARVDEVEAFLREVS